MEPDGARTAPRARTAHMEPDGARDAFRDFRYDAAKRWRDHVRELKRLAEFRSNLVVAASEERDLVVLTVTVPNPVDPHTCRAFLLAWERGDGWPRFPPRLAGHNLPLLEENIAGVAWDRCGRNLAAFAESYALRLSEYAAHTAGVVRGDADDWACVDADVGRAGRSPDSARARSPPHPPSFEDDLQRALELSMRESESAGGAGRAAGGAGRAAVGAGGAGGGAGEEKQADR